MDRLNAPGNSAPHKATEMNFGLRSAGNGRRARHGRYERCQCIWEML